MIEKYENHSAINHNYSIFYPFQFQLCKNKRNESFFSSPQLSSEGKIKNIRKHGK